MASGTILRVVKCVECETDHDINIKLADWKAWREGALIQKVMPYLTNAERELLISQICDSCWSKMFVDDEDD